MNLQTLTLFIAKICNRFNPGWLLLIGLIIIGTSCKDIFETDISNESVTLISPGDSVTTPYTSQVFSWAPLSDALDYEIQIVTPSFNNIQLLIMDSTTTLTQCTVSLFPGNFQWRVRALNGSSSTNYSMRSFEVDSALNFSSQSVVILSPDNNAYTNQQTITFQWSPLYMAVKYWVEIHANDWSGTNVINSRFTANDTLIVPSIPGGTYVWGVQAFNSNGASTQFSERTLTVDLTAPGAPTLTSPTNGATVNQTSATLHWSDVNETGIQLFDSVLVANDSASLYLSKQLVIQQKVMADSLTMNVTNGLKYWWRVKTIDAAGNQSPYSSIWEFTVKTN